jgi:hypothetical protein
LAHLINEYDTRNDFCDALVHIPLDDLIYLPPQLISHLRPATFHQTPHHAHDVLATLWSRIGSVKVAESNVLNELFAFVDIPFGKRDIGLGFKVV